MTRTNSRIAALIALALVAIAFVALGGLSWIVERDRQDMTRAVAPLKQADDAVLLDTSSLTLEESIAAVLRIIREKTEEKA